MKKPWTYILITVTSFIIGYQSMTIVSFKHHNKKCNNYIEEELDMISSVKVFYLYRHRFPVIYNNLIDFYVESRNARVDSCNRAESIHKQIKPKILRNKFKRATIDYEDVWDL